MHIGYIIWQSIPDIFKRILSDLSASLDIVTYSLPDHVSYAIPRLFKLYTICRQFTNGFVTRACPVPLCMQTIRKSKANFE